MGRLIGFVMTLLIVIYMSGCSHSYEEETMNDENVTLTIQNNTNVEMNGIEIIGYQNGDRTFTQGSAYADGSEIEQGESMEFQFEESEFDLNDNSSFEILLLDNEETLVTITSTNVQFKKVGPGEYYLELTDTIE
ncbi:hypothetical protein [Alkalicoccobacillus porphyridii]|uniref:Uncharacterized protein n=1 Tax=Alkalicoccobacillus porphyridii TaxID=2597270 RepID=A0A553ZVR8_9BACI|nr:hypothetical protein [Alkalicoccobacillus porphyridii]TSB45569.1 hypothetical protein FN960_15480 [Alkalicoccobacillus porphyridii]